MNAQEPVASNGQTPDRMKHRLPGSVWNKAGGPPVRSRMRGRPAPGMAGRVTGKLVPLVAALALLFPGAGWSRRVAAPDPVPQEVRHELMTLPFYLVFDHLDFRVDGGVVTLLGQVTRPSLKSDAEKAVRGIAGVQRVENKIEILPVSPVDEKLRLAEYLAIFGDPQLNQYALRAMPPVHIIVKNGAVTLDGSVATETDKTEAFTQASSVAGVTSLTNHLRVAP